MEKPPNEISFLEADKHSIYPQNISDHNEEIDTNNIYYTLQYVNYYIHLQKNLFDMKMHLFSHKFQKPAILTFIVSQVIVFVFYFVRFLQNPEQTFNPFPDNIAILRVVLFLYVLAVYGSLFFIIFSKEKVEDEYISKIRLESVAIVAAFVICISFVLLLIQCVQPLDSYREFRQMVRDLFAGFVYWAPFVYICVFKYKLRHQA